MTAAAVANWVLIGDDRLFFLFCTNAAGFGWYGRNSYCFSDLISFKPGDNYATVLAADDNYRMSNYWSYPGSSAATGWFRRLDFTGKVRCAITPNSATGAVWAHVPEHEQRQQICGRARHAFPNGTDYSLWLLPTYVRQEDGHMRGILPGMLWMPQRPAPQRSNHRGQRGRSGGKRFLLVRTQYSSKPKARRSRSTSPGRGGKP